MKSMNIGKSSTQFFETAAELDNIVLSNKTYQETRFVRSLLWGITSALRNLPTLIAVIAKEYNQAHKNHETTKTKLLKPILDTLRKAEILFFTIGFAQLLEIYAGVSLSVQYAYHFPIQMWSKIDAAKSEIIAL